MKEVNKNWEADQPTKESGVPSRLERTSGGWNGLKSNQVRYNVTTNIIKYKPNTHSNSKFPWMAYSPPGHLVSHRPVECLGELEEV